MALREKIASSGTTCPICGAWIAEDRHCRHVKRQTIVKNEKGDRLVKFEFNDLSWERKLS